MNTLFLNAIDVTALFAQEAGGGGAEGANPWAALLQGPLFLVVMLIVMFYFIVLRPQKREQSRRQEMLNAIKKNDRVLTIGGIYGVVTNVHREADEVTIKVDEATNTKLRLTLSSIGRVLGDDASASSNDK